MKIAFESVLNKLWTSHDDTKNLLNLFSSKGTTKRQEKAMKDASQLMTEPPHRPENEKKDADKSYTKAQLIGLLLGPTFFIGLMFFFSPEGLAPEGKAVLAVTAWVATWWITEAIPIPVASLLPILLLPLTGALDSGTVTSAYGNDIIFLFLGGFFIALAMEKWNLHQRIALFIISVIGSSTQRILLGFMVATGFLSMWVSNTAAVMMMIPMGLAITAQVADSLKGQAEQSEIPKFEKALIFGIGYAGTIGGLGTLIGTPPNIILAAQVQELFGVEISFASWMMVAVPIVIILLLSTWFYLGRMAFKMTIKGLPGGKKVIQTERQKLGKMSSEEKAVAIVFVVTAFFWISREFIWVNIFPDIKDGMIAILATVILFMIPARRSRVLDWEDSREIPWGILLLFGGGLAIAAGFKETGLSEWIGSQLTVLDGMNLILVMGLSSLLILVLTEFTSNTATATMILPVLAALALSLNIHPYALMIPAAMAANSAFMLPVATPPNAIIFGTGRIKIIEMIRVGFIINIFVLFLIVLAVYFLVPLFWGIDLHSVPIEFLK